MDRDHLINTIFEYKEKIIPTLNGHQSYSQEEEHQILDRFLSFIRESPDCFKRSNLSGHITGSAFVISPDKSKVVLTLHKKLGKWLQLGGHSDGNPLPHEVALQETNEESGLKELSLVSLLSSHETPLPFDFDIHRIPEHKGIPEHYHFDVRYLIQAKDHSLTISDESSDLKWFALKEAKLLNDERSMIRQFDKLEYFRNLDI